MGVHFLKDFQKMHDNQATDSLIFLSDQITKIKMAKNGLKKKEKKIHFIVTIY